MSSPNTVIQVENLSKRFVVRKDKSLKERLVNFTRSQQHKEDFWALRGVSVDIEAGTLTVTPPLGLFEELADDDAEPTGS